MEQFLKHLADNFAIDPELLKDFKILKFGDELFIMSKEAAIFKELRPMQRGIRMAKVFKHSSKLSTSSIQLFGKFAKKNIVQLDYDEALRFAQGFELVLRSQPSDIEEGFVIVKYYEFALGIGNYKEGKLKSRVPRSQVLRT